MTEPHFSINFTARVLPVSNAVAKGDVLVFSSSASYQGTTGWWVVASSANRATADSRAQAIALTAYGGSAIGTVTYQSAGVVATEISGLAATTTGTYKLVRVSSAGRLERITNYTSGDDVVGYAYPDGRVALHIGLPWEFIASLAGNITGRKVVYGDGVLAGAAHATIANDGALELGADRDGGAATTGDLRLASNGGIYARSGDGTTNRCLAWCAYDPGFPEFDIPPSEGLIFGDDHSNIGVAMYGGEFEFCRTGDNTFKTKQGFFGACSEGYSTQFSSGAKVFFAGVNLWLRNSRDSGLLTDPVSGAVGIFRMDPMLTAPTVTPSGCALFRVNSSNSYHLETLLPGANPSTGWRDLLSSSETTVNVTSATPGDIAITSATRVVNCNATDMIIRGFTKPTTPAAGVISITNSNATPITVNIGNPVSAGNGVGAPVSPGTTLSIPENAALTVSYDYNATEWVAHYGVTANVP